MQTYVELFHKATKLPARFPYQEKFALAAELPELVHAPTGAGKTAMAVLGWVWRYFHTKLSTPRRLVYCLPMRVLVEQTRDEIRKWLTNLGLAETVAVHVLMGGEDADEWDLDPEKPAIVVGTQDMLLSRALNRGYGMSRYRWPMHFALLNNDCLWVLDEIQLMGTGLATSTQLQAFRESLGTYGSVQTIWMSATLLPGWLASIDFRDRIEPKLRLRTLTLDPIADYRAPGLRDRWNAAKPLVQFDGAAEAPQVAEFVKRKHVPGSLTLVIVNTVDRARTLFEALGRAYLPPRKSKKETKSPANEAVPEPDLKLIHSRFRPHERAKWKDWLRQDAQMLRESNAMGRIVISTQVVEAGVDLSARTLITELAPWPSLVQRFGRCNRKGEFIKENPAQAFWIDLDDKKAAPYSKEEMKAAREQLRPVGDAGLKSLTHFFDNLSDPGRAKLFPYEPPHVIRRKDFIDLFDTTPDLAGNDIDVARFIRDSEDLDVQVFWRAGPPPTGELTQAEARRIAPQRDELCPVPVERDDGIKAFLANKHEAFRWDALESKWIPAKPDDAYPGQVYWIPKDEGGYDEDFGWQADKKALSESLWLRDPDAEVQQKKPQSDVVDDPGYDTDALSVSGYQMIAEHTDDVLRSLDVFLAKLPGMELPAGVLRLAARWHDWGKAHEVFQLAITKPENGAPGTLWAKAPDGCWKKYTRPHFRHELASALGVLTLLNSQRVPEDWAALSPALQNLALYLLASHHGKVRLSIRSMPEEKTPKRSGAMFARGVWDGDPLPATQLGGNVLAPSVNLDLSPILLGRIEGRPSWVERMLNLRDSAVAGPLRLAYLESLLRASDMLASRGARQRTQPEKGAQA